MYSTIYTVPNQAGPITHLIPSRLKKILRRYGLYKPGSRHPLGAIEQKLVWTSIYCFPATFFSHLILGPLALFLFGPILCAALLILLFAGFYDMVYRANLRRCKDTTRATSQTKKVSCPLKNQKTISDLSSGSLSSTSQSDSNFQDDAFAILRNKMLNSMSLQFEQAGLLPKIEHCQIREAGDSETYIGGGVVIQLKK